MGDLVSATKVSSIEDSNSARVLLGDGNEIVAVADRHSSDTARLNEALG